MRGIYTVYGQSVFQTRNSKKYHSVWKTYVLESLQTNNNVKTLQNVFEKFIKNNITVCRRHRAGREAAKEADRLSNLIASGLHDRLASGRQRKKIKGAT